MIQLIQQYWPILLQGFGNTLWASILALIGSTVLGTICGTLQVTENPLLRGVATAYVEFFRNIPLLVVVMFFYVVVPSSGWQLDGFQSGVVGLTLYTTAFIADAVRGGLLAVERGQIEAGIAQGFRRREVLWYVILPQAIRLIVPSLGNQFISLVKNSSVLAMVAGLDLMYYGDFIASETFATVDTYVLIAVCYLALTVPLTLLMQRLERRLRLTR